MMSREQYRANSPGDDDDYDDNQRRQNRNDRSASQDKINQCEERIAKNIYDTEAWTSLMSEVKAMDIEMARPYYERFVLTYPTAGKYWKQYAEAEMQVSNYDKAEAIFKRCLHSCLNVELWRSYLNYIRDIKEKQDPNQNIAQAAYEYALDHVGKDISSTEIWNEFIDYLRNQKPSLYDQNHGRLRSTFQRAIGNPMHELDRIWRDYEQFENATSKATAKQTIADNQPRFKTAWNKYKEKKNMREGLLINMLARPPCGSHKEEQQKRIWLALIEFEKRNTQRFTNEELQSRVKFIYNQALLCLYHYPEVWYDAAMYCAESNVPTAVEESMDMFERACLALPKNILINLSFADFCEVRKFNDRAKTVYEKLLESRSDSIIFIQYQKFIRRTVSFEAARDVFIRARRADCSYHMYIASAMMEYQINNNANVATKVFELGLKQFINEPIYILNYLKHLEHLNDKNNQRVVFEKVLNTLPKQRAHEIWNKYLEFEEANGDPSTIEKAQTRKDEAYSTELVEVPTNNIMDGNVTLSYDETMRPNRIGKLIDRFRFMDLWPVRPDEMELMELDHNHEAGSHWLILSACAKADKERDVAHLSNAVNHGELRTEDPRRTKLQKDTAAKLKLNKYKQQFFRPNVDQMVLLNSTMAPASLSSIDNYLPEAVIAVLKLVPAHMGMMPNVDFVMESLRVNPLPPPPQQVMPRGGGVKRPNPDDDDDDDDDDGYSGNKPPANDIYGRRRAQKLQKTQ
ncbi:cleavage stimulation factor subunit 3 [Acrasis kona]|uniref:Cleavage stimulation factor subunit 3 n=1 Tax=Acrasis kona TaxID=1008807 RepID=A0AAW2ZEP9_9EUKA